MDRIKDFESELFRGLSDTEIENYIKVTNSKIKTFHKDEFVFKLGDTPKYLFILLSGKIAIENTDIDGNLSLVRIFDKPGTVFGEVFLYLDDKKYENSTICKKESSVLMIDKKFLTPNSLKISTNNSSVHSKIISNMLYIISRKAYFFNKKLEITSSSSIRNKILKFLYEHNKGGFVELDMSKTSLAEFLGIPRPSLSRELSNMKAENIIREIDNKIYFDI